MVSDEQFPNLGATYGTYNFPKLRIVGIQEFVENGYFEKWVEIKRNPYWKYDSACNILAYSVDKDGKTNS